MLSCVLSAKKKKELLKCNKKLFYEKLIVLNFFYELTTKQISIKHIMIFSVNIFDKRINVMQNKF